MIMNIYITQENEQWLRNRSKSLGSMSGLVNELIDKERGSAGMVGRVVGVTVDEIKQANGLIIEPRKRGSGEITGMQLEPIEGMTLPEVLPIVNTPIVSQSTPVKQFDFCKHGNVKGLCKKGCK